jgi:ACS family hexuronate transporter-like MFS transporter
MSNHLVDSSAGIAHTSLLSPMSPTQSTAARKTSAFWLHAWIPVMAMQMVSLVSFIDRNTLSLLAPAILRETHLSGEQYGYIISAFSVAYMIGNPIWGWILDRFGLRVGMGCAVLSWTVASISHAFANGFWGFAAARATLGFGEGATFPGGLRTATQTLPIEKRGRGTAIAYSGGALGAIVTPIVMTPVYLWWGWRAAFWFTGCIGLGWLAMWTLVSRRRDLACRHEHRQTKIPAFRLRDPRLWGFVSAYALGALPMGFVIYDAAIYLSQALGKSQTVIGKVLWIPPLGWEIGYFFWGWIADRLVRSGMSPLEAQRRILTTVAVMSLPFALIPGISIFWLMLAELFFAMFTATGFVIASLGYATHVFSVGHSGLIAGIGAGSWGAAVALTMPILGRLLDQHRYYAAFILVTACPVVGYALWTAMNAMAGRHQKTGPDYT